MPEKFEPVKVAKVKDKSGKVEEYLGFEFKPEGNLGQAAKENFRLERIFEAQKTLIQKHLDTFKAKAKAKYLDWQFDKLDAYNNALQAYAKVMNDILRDSVKDVNKIRKKHPEWFDSLSGSVTKQLNEVGKIFGSQLEEKIKLNANTLIAGIIKNAKDRSKLNKTISRKKRYDEKVELASIGRPSH